MKRESPLQRPIFHIGYHKTATTWFQKSVWPAATSHEFIGRKQARSALLDDPGLCFDEKRARAMLQRRGSNRAIVVCEENLSGYIHNGGLHGLMAPEAARRIHRLFPEAQIVVFIRNQPDIIRAAYCQYVSGGGTYGLSRYLFPHLHGHGALRYAYKAPGFSLSHFEFDRLIAFYDDLFGRGNVHVYLFEELQRDPKKLLARMEQDLGVEFDHAAISDASKNASMGRAALFIMRGVNLFTRQSVVDKTVVLDVPGWHFVRHGMKAMVGRIPVLGTAGKRLLSSAQLARIRSHYAAGNRRLIRRRGLPLEEYGYPL
jgi:hypothetical protein